MSELLVELSDVQSFIGDDASKVPHLEQWNEGLSAFIRRYIDGPIETTAYSESLDGTGETTVMLSYRPVLSLTSLTIDGTAVAVDDDGLEFYEHGLLYYDGGFTSGRKNVVVGYTAGYGDAVPEDLKLAVMLILEQAAQTKLLQQVTRGEYAYVFAPTKWPDDARDIVNSYKRVF